MFFGQCALPLAIVTRTADDDFDEHLARVCLEGNTSVVPASCPVLLLAQYIDGGVLTLLWHLTPPPDLNNVAIELGENGGGLAWT